VLVELADVAVFARGLFVDPAKGEALGAAHVGARVVDATRAFVVEEGAGSGRMWRAFLQE